MILSDKKKEKEFYVYILRCSDNSLYTGYTVDIKKRLNSHEQGIASKYTRARLPVTLVYHETHNSKSSAMKREYEIKKLNKIQKEILINKNNYKF